MQIQIKFLKIGCRAKIYLCVNNVDRKNAGHCCTNRGQGSCCGPDDVYSVISLFNNTNR